MFTHTLIKKLSPKRMGMTSLALIGATSLLWTPQAYAAESPGVEWEKTFNPGTYQAQEFQVEKHGDILFTKRKNSQTEVLRIDESGEVTTKLTFPYTYMNAIEQTNSGGYILSPYNGDENILVMKTNKDGKTLWEKTLNKKGKLLHVIQTSTDDYIIAGTVNLPDNTTATYVAKLDEEGEVLWEKTIQNNDLQLDRIQETTDSNIILIGVLWKIEPGDLSNSDLYVSKMDSAGNTVWEITHETGNSTYSKTAAATPDGGVIIAGEDKTIDYYPDKKGYLVKVSKDGNIQWEKTLPRRSGLRYIGATKDGNYILNGYVNYQGINNFYSYSDEYIAKIDGDGNTLWDKTFAGNKDEEDFTLDESRHGVIFTQTHDGGYLEIGQDDNHDTLFLTKLQSE